MLSLFTIAWWTQLWRLHICLSTTDSSALAKKIKGCIPCLQLYCLQYWVFASIFSYNGWFVFTVHNLTALQHNTTESESK